MVKYKMYLKSIDKTCANHVDFNKMLDEKIKLIRVYNSDQ